MRERHAKLRELRAEAKKRKGRRAFATIVTGSIIVLVAVILFLTTVGDVFCGSERNPPEGVCLSHVCSMGVYLLDYAKHHNGNFPEDLSVIREYYWSGELLICPFSGRNPWEFVRKEAPVSYDYVSGLREDDPPEMILLYCAEPRHEELIPALTVGRECVFFDRREELERLVEKQVNELRAAGRKVRIIRAGTVSGR